MVCLEESSITILRPKHLALGSTFYFDMWVMFAGRWYLHAGRVSLMHPDLIHDVNLMNLAVLSWYSRTRYVYRVI